MTFTAWRERLIFVAMSVFIAWHTLAIVIAPMSSRSMTAQGLRAVLQPYLTLFRLDNTWDFFSPTANNPFTSRQLAYLIEDKSGKKQFLMPESEYSGLEPRYFWFRSWHFAIIDGPNDYADIAAAFYCKKHAALHPVAITLLALQGKEFTLSDFLAGKPRWGPEFVVAQTIKHAKCPAE